MKSRNELMTVNQLQSILNTQIEKGNGDKFIFVNEYYIENTNEPYGEGKDTIYFPDIHIQDVLEYIDETGDEID